jgi:DNA-binding MarR family transcriptional regulator
VSGDTREAADAESAGAGSSLAHDPADRLGYLLKHAWLRLGELTAAALQPYGVDGRELAVLLTLADREPASQQQAARSLGIDRTTMVALLDALERKGLVARRPHAEDRRRNVVELTASGSDTLRRAAAAGRAAERRFLGPLTDAQARQLKEALHAVVTAGAGTGTSGTDGTSGGFAG